jgi:hypothetical protein
MLQCLILFYPENSSPNFSSPPWNNAILITPRHGVHIHWNSAVSQKHCCLQQQSMVLSHAEDLINRCQLTRQERSAFALHLQSNTRDNSMLLSIVEPTIRLRVMVTRNFDTDLDITNGAWGMISDIVLPADLTPESNDQGDIIHQYPPAFILVKLDRTRAVTLPGLDSNVIPIQPVTKSCHVTLHNQKACKQTVCCSQLPITAMYACTDYHSQGQTIPAPTGGLNMFNLYVILSHGKEEKPFLLPSSTLRAL